MSLTQQLVEYICACFTGIWIQSAEHEDALREIAHMCRDQDWKLASWDVDRGLQIPGSDQPADAGGNDPLAAIRSINALADADSSAPLVLQNFHRFIQSAEIVQALASQITAGKQNRTFIIVLAPIVEIPTELEKQFVVLEHDLPGREQLEDLARDIATEQGELTEGGPAGHPRWLRPHRTRFRWPGTPMKPSKGFGGGLPAGAFPPITRDSTREIRTPARSSGQEGPPGRSVEQLTARMRLFWGGVRC